MIAKFLWQKNSKYLIFFIVLLSLRMADLYLTYQITPDLSREWNPLVSYFNLSWQGFVGVQFMLVLLALFAFHNYKIRILNPVDKYGLNMHRFIYYYFHGQDFSFNHFKQNLVTMPSKRKLKLSRAFNGFVLAASFVLVSLFAILHNILILGDFPWYHIFVHRYNELYLPSVYISLVAGSCLVFFVREYQRYKSVGEKAASSEMFSIR